MNAVTFMLSQIRVTVFRYFILKSLFIPAIFDAWAIVAAAAANEGPAFFLGTDHFNDDRGDNKGENDTDNNGGKHFIISWNLSVMLDLNMRLFLPAE